MTEAKLNGHCSNPSLIAPPSCHRQAEPETGTTKVQTENLPPLIALVARFLGKSRRHGQATHVDQSVACHSFHRYAVHELKKGR